MDIKLYSYLFGLFGTDGNVRRNKNNTHIYELTLELIDKDIIDKIYQVLSNCSISERTRDTNFKRNYHSYVLRCHNKEFINWCEQNNFPLKNKTNIFKPPVKLYDEASFWRGVIDGDGSIGKKNADGQPFISLTTKSEALKEAYLDFIETNTGFRPSISRNIRDNVYNITIHGKKALKIMEVIYKDNNICLDRKYQKYLVNKDWKGKERIGGAAKRWTSEEEADLLVMTNKDFIKKYPYRTLVAARGKRSQLTGSASDKHLNKKGGEECQ